MDGRTAFRENNKKNYKAQESVESHDRYIYTDRRSEQPVKVLMKAVFTHLLTVVGRKLPHERYTGVDTVLNLPLGCNEGGTAAESESPKTEIQFRDKK